jgi:hypothetical protein
VGYLVGMASVASFADGLGVTVRDLGVGTQDHLALAAVYGLAIMAFVAAALGAVLVVFGVLWPNTGRKAEREEAARVAKGLKWRLSSRTLLVVVAVLMAALIALSWPIVAFGLVERALGFPNDAATAIALLVLLAALVVIARSLVQATGATGPDLDGWWRLGRLRVVPPSRWARAAAVLVLLFVPIVTTRLAILSGTKWAEEILAGSIGDQPSVPGERPWALHLIIQPAIGQTSGACVVRLSNTVVVLDGFSVVQPIESFVANGC